MSYDNHSRLTAESLDGTTKTFTYDNSDQLTADGTNTFTYDANGNRNNGSYTTGAGNRLTSDGTWTYSYDDEGNITKKSLGSSAETWTYGYDHLNHLTWVEKRATDGGTLQLRSEYKYDVWGNRLEKKVDTNGDAGYETTQRYGYDGWKTGPQVGFIGLENFDVWADLDGSNALTTRYIRGDVVDELFARIEGTGGAAYWYLTDRLGSIRHVTDNSGVLKDTIAYDGFGNISSESDSSFGGRYKWTGREFDTESGFQYNRSRYYDPRIGRWTSQDPIGFNAGDSNLYRYVFNEYPLATDPSGYDANSAVAGAWNKISSDWQRDSGISEQQAVGQGYAPFYQMAEMLAAEGATPEQVAMFVRMFERAHALMRTKVWVKIWNQDIPNRRRDWFAKASDFCAGVGDTVSLGGTKWIRRIGGYDDVVDPNSTSYKVGGYTGQAINIGLIAANPAGASKLVGSGLKLINGVQTGGAVANIGEGVVKGDAGAVAQGVAGLVIGKVGGGNPCSIPSKVIGIGAGAIGAGQGVNEIINGDPIKGSLQVVQGLLGINKGMNSCFAAGTPILGEDGSKCIEEYRVGERVWSRDENDPDGPLQLKRIEDVFSREALIIHLHVGGKVIRTTAEHPFYVKGKGWVEAIRNDRSIVV